MSFPQLLPDSDPGKDYVTFSVPNERVVKKIVRDSDEVENLRVKAASQSLTDRIKELALLFSKYNLEASPIEDRNEVLVRLFVPPPPTRPPPPSPPEREIMYSSQRRRSSLNEPQLDGLKEDVCKSADCGMAAFGPNGIYDSQRPRLSPIEEENEEED